MADDDFTTGDSGASTTYPVQCSALRKNGYVMLKGQPCKIIEMSTSKTGKHGHAKVHLVGLQVFTQKRFEDLCPSTHNMDVPRILRKDFTVLDIQEGYLTLLSDNGDTREDLKVPDNDVGKDILKKLNNSEISEEFMVTVMKVLDEEQIIAVKN